MQKRVSDHVTGKNTAPENVSLTAGYSEDGEKRRVERPGSDTKTRQDAIQASNGALGLEALGRNSGEIGN